MQSLHDASMFEETCPPFWHLQSWNASKMIGSMVPLMVAWQQGPIIFTSLGLFTAGAIDEEPYRLPCVNKTALHAGIFPAADAGAV